MFNFRPPGSWPWFNVEPPADDPPGFRIATDGSVRDDVAFAGPGSAVGLSPPPRIGFAVEDRLPKDNPFYFLDRHSLASPLGDMPPSPQISPIYSWIMKPPPSEPELQGYLDNVDTDAIRRSPKETQAFTTTTMRRGASCKTRLVSGPSNTIAPATTTCPLLTDQSRRSRAKIAPRPIYTARHTSSHRREILSRKRSTSFLEFMPALGSIRSTASAARFTHQPNRASWRERIAGCRQCVRSAVRRAGAIGRRAHRFFPWRPCRTFRARCANGVRYFSGSS